MKFSYLFVFAFLLFTSCQPQDKDGPIATTETGSKIEIIDFHTTHRCQTCLKIEDSTNKLLQADFKKEMDAGTITFRVVNIDDEANYKMAERFQAAGTALFINVVRNGEEQHIDLTDFAFMKAYDDEFANELKAKIEAQLKTL
ncbi:nitrophenyl compound nitroreductase subunit ArsF family protein [Neolewinella persica]|uniref:nitrophenyl compound nitroreductase subunit ArsF family protein n=1 Tax=Neolewinella persica TaxID=70998 RepID=UPI0003612003|nr:nitrophenyl compound nitroreductase subunit ArsF family protein [Neolewinella persica]